MLIKFIAQSRDYIHAVVNKIKSSNETTFLIFTDYKYYDTIVCI